MITLEQVDKLREKANISYDEAKAALEAANGDVLEAIINLEKQGKVSAPEGDGYYSSGKKEAPKGKWDSSKHKEQNAGENIKDLLGRFIKFCAMIIHKGNINSIEVIKNNEVKTAFSVTVLVVLAIFLFWVTIPLIIIGPFLGYRYRFKGPDLGKESVNNAMDSAANAAETVKKSFVEGKSENKE